MLSRPVFQQQSGHLLLVMVTSAKHSQWPSDWPIEDLLDSGLPQACIVRIKLFTHDQSLLLCSLGRLSTRDQRGACSRLADDAALSPSEEVVVKSAD